MIVIYRKLIEKVNFDPTLNLEFRGAVTMKGKPEPMNCWLLTRNKSTMSKTQSLSPAKSLAITTAV